jgi:hypothetical protein
MSENERALAVGGGGEEIVGMIDAAQERAWRAVNTELVALYWESGKWLSARSARAEWGDKVVANAAEYLASRRPDLKGYNRRTLHRMLEFYETYKDDEIVTPLVTPSGVSSRSS